MIAYPRYPLSALLSHSRFVGNSTHDIRLILKSRSRLVIARIISFALGAGRRNIFFAAYFIVVKCTLFFLKHRRKNRLFFNVHNARRLFLYSFVTRSLHPHVSICPLSVSIARMRRVPGSFVNCRTCSPAILPHCLL